MCVCVHVCLCTQLNVDLNRHWNLPSSSVALDDATLSRLHNLSWEADTGPDVMVDQMPRQVSICDTHTHARAGARTHTQARAHTQGLT